MRGDEGTPDEAADGFVPFEAGEHTADLALVARGRTLARLFENAALGLAWLLYDPSGVAMVDEEPVKAEGSDEIELLVAWLQEILYRHEVHRRRFRTFRVVAVEPPSPGTGHGSWSVVGVAAGERFDPARHPRRGDIKAATYHDLRIEHETTPSGPLLRARIVLDT